MEMKDQVFDSKELSSKKKVRKVKTEEQLQKKPTSEDHLTENQETDRNIHTEREMVSSNGNQPRRHFDIEAQNKLAYG